MEEYAWVTAINRRYKQMEADRRRKELEERHNKQMARIEFFLEVLRQSSSNGAANSCDEAYEPDRDSPSHNLDHTEIVDSRSKIDDGADAFVLVPQEEIATSESHFDASESWSEACPTSKMLLTRSDEVESLQLHLQITIPVVNCHVFDEMPLRSRVQSVHLIAESPMIVADLRKSQQQISELVFDSPILEVDRNRLTFGEVQQKEIDAPESWPKDFQVASSDFISYVPEPLPPCLRMVWMGLMLTRLSCVRQNVPTQSPPPKPPDWNHNDVAHSVPLPQPLEQPCLRFYSTLQGQSIVRLGIISDMVVVADTQSHSQSQVCGDVILVNCLCYWSSLWYESCHQSIKLLARILTTEQYLIAFGGEYNYVTIIEEVLTVTNVALLHGERIYNSNTQIIPTAVDNLDIWHVVSDTFTLEINSWMLMEDEYLLFYHVNSHGATCFSNYVLVVWVLKNKVVIVHTTEEFVIAQEAWFILFPTLLWAYECVGEILGGKCTHVGCFYNKDVFYYIHEPSLKELSCLGLRCNVEWGRYISRTMLQIHYKNLSYWKLLHKKTRECVKPLEVAIWHEVAGVHFCLFQWHLKEGLPPPSFNRPCSWLLLEMMGLNDKALIQLRDENDVSVFSLDEQMEDITSKELVSQKHANSLVMLSIRPQACAHFLLPDVSDFEDYGSAFDEIDKWILREVLSGLPNGLEIIFAIYSTEDDQSMLLDWIILVVWTILIVWERLACIREFISPSVMVLGKALAGGTLSVRAPFALTNMICWGQHGNNPIGLIGDGGELKQDGFGLNGSLLEHLLGITYFHLKVKSRLTHCGIKLSILVREALETKVLYFGLRKSETSENPLHVSNRFKGELGFINPSNCSRYHWTKFSVVCSFGVMLMQQLAYFEYKDGNAAEWHQFWAWKIVRSISFAQRQASIPAQHSQFKQWDPGKFLLFVGRLEDANYK